MTALPEDQQVPVAFSLPDDNGIVRHMSDFQGKTVLINFWATWCAPCREEMPALSRLHQARADKDFRVLAIHVGPGDVAPFLEAIPVAFPIWIDEDLELAHLDVHALPTTILVSPEGRVIYQRVGVREWDSEEAHAFFDALATPEPSRY